MTNSTKINKLEQAENWKKGSSFLGCKYPIISGGMSYVSEHNLVAAVSNSGAFGVLAASTLNKETLAEEINKVRSITNNNFGVNLILLHPRIEELAQTCIDKKVKYVVLAGGIPDKKLVSKLKEAGIKVMAFAPSLLVAKKLINYKVDALVIEGSEAGGHIGPCSTMILAQEILPNIKEVPVFVAGGIGTGAAVTNFIDMGASGVQIGTILVCTKESIAHIKFKEAFIKAKARHAEVSVQIDKNFPVIPVRSIANKGTEDFLKVQKDSINSYYAGKLTKEEAILKIENYWVGSLKRAVIDGDIEYGSLMAGQSVGFVNSISSVKEIINNLVAEANLSYK